MAGPLRPTNHRIVFSEQSSSKQLKASLDAAPAQFHSRLARMHLSGCPATVLCCSAVLDAVSFRPIDGGGRHYDCWRRFIARLQVFAP